SEAGSPRKELYLFQGAGHTMEMAANGPAYREHVQKFVKSLQ
ncbi:MAG TPA: alpha/beta hydrolase, partial [Dialister sp.]|nr:alpha/beta hydrolase [Dialister sp.]